MQKLIQSFHRLPVIDKVIVLVGIVEVIGFTILIDWL